MEVLMKEKKNVSFAVCFTATADTAPATVHRHMKLCIFP